MDKTNEIGPVWLMQPIPHFGEKLGKGWIYEPKIDGWRMQIVKYSNGKIECWVRRLEKKPNWTDNRQSQSQTAGLSL